MASTSIKSTRSTQSEEKKKKLLEALGLGDSAHSSASGSATSAGSGAEGETTLPKAETGDTGTAEKTSGEKLKELQDAILNRENFTYDAEKDPKYASIRKSYLRDSKRAASDALAEAAANTGGVASSYAVTAATEAGDYYASKMSDELSALYDDAYNRYLKEHSLKQNDLSILDAEYERRYQLALQMANLGDDSYLRALADEYGGKASAEGSSGGTSSSGSSSSGTSSGGGYSYTLPEPTTETENRTETVSDITDELPEPDETLTGKATDGGTVAGDEDNKAPVNDEDNKSPVNPENATNQNAAWEKSGLSRDEYDERVRKKTVSTLGGATNAYNYLKGLDVDVMSERGFGAFKSQTNAVLNGKKVGYKGDDTLLKYAADYCETYADYLNFMLGYIS